MLTINNKFENNDLNPSVSILQSKFIQDLLFFNLIFLSLQRFMFYYSSTSALPRYRMETDPKQDLDMETDNERTEELEEGAKAENQKTEEGSTMSHSVQVPDTFSGEPDFSTLETNEPKEKTGKNDSSEQQTINRPDLEASLTPSDKLMALETSDNMETGMEIDEPDPTVS